MEVMSSTVVRECDTHTESIKHYSLSTPPKRGVSFALKIFTSKFYALPKIVLDKQLKTKYNISILKNNKSK